VQAAEQAAPEKESLVKALCASREAVSSLEEQLCDSLAQSAALEVTLQAAEESVRDHRQAADEVLMLRGRLADSEEIIHELQQKLDRAVQAAKALSQGASASEVERSVLETSNATIATNYETVLHQLRQELQGSIDENCALRRQQQAAQSLQQQRHRDEARRLAEQISDLQSALQEKSCVLADVEARCAMAEQQTQYERADKDTQIAAQKRELLLVEKAVAQLRDDFETVRTHVLQAQSHAVTKGLQSPTPSRHNKARSLGGELTPISSNSNSRPGTGCRPTSAAQHFSPIQHPTDALLQEWSPGQFNRQVERARQEKDVTELQRQDAARLFEELLTHVDERSRALQSIARQLDLLGAGAEAEAVDCGEKDLELGAVPQPLAMCEEESLAMSFPSKSR
jgi:hypothetical protein